MRKKHSRKAKPAKIQKVKADEELQKEPMGKSQVDRMPNHAKKLT